MSDKSLCFGLVLKEEKKELPGCSCNVPSIPLFDQAVHDFFIFLICHYDVISVALTVIFYFLFFIFIFIFFMGRLNGLYARYKGKKLVPFSNNFLFLRCDKIYNYGPLCIYIGMDISILINNSIFPYCIFFFFFFKFI